MFFLFLSLIQSVENFENIEVEIGSEKYLQKKYKSVEQKINQISNIENDLISLQNLRKKQFAHSQGDEVKPIALVGIQKDRTVEYENSLKFIPSFGNSGNPNTPYCLSRAPILSYQLIGGKNTRTFASQVKIVFPTKSQCNIRQCVFAFKNRTNNFISVSYKTQPIDLSNTQGTVRTIDLETEVEFNEFDVDVLLNWGDQKRTCIPEIEIIGPVHNTY